MAHWRPPSCCPGYEGTQGCSGQLRPGIQQWEWAQSVSLPLVVTYQGHQNYVRCQIIHFFPTGRRRLSVELLAWSSRTTRPWRLSPYKNDKRQPIRGRLGRVLQDNKLDPLHTWKPDPAFCWVTIMDVITDNMVVSCTEKELWQSAWLAYKVSNNKQWVIFPISTTAD